MSTDQRVAALADGILCYLHLWGALHKHVLIPHDDIAPDIGLWDDLQGGYFAGFTQDDPRKLRRDNSYVCALGDDGPVLGQLERMPPAKIVSMPMDVRELLGLLARHGPQSTQSAITQIETLAKLLDEALPVLKRSQSGHR